MPRARWWVPLGLLLAGCPSTPGGDGGSPDGGAPRDSGSGGMDAGSGNDAGPSDAGGNPDAGFTPDSGTTADAGNFQNDGTYGEPVPTDMPNWQERATLVLVNAVRMSPTGYKTEYAADNSPPFGSILGATYPAQPPLRWNAELNASSREHSVDMGADGCFQHDSCDGGNVFTRIMSYYTLSGTLGEDIAAGFTDPRADLNLWLCDATASACAADGSGSDGHRANIMSANYAATGVGYFENAASTFGSYYTQDFGGVADGPMPPLVDGVHIPFPTGQVSFLANFSDTGPAQGIVLVLDGVAMPMSVDLGTTTAGTWKSIQGTAGSCRSYHFEATTQAGLLWRFPAAGELRTFGDGTCAEDYAP